MNSIENDESDLSRSDALSKCSDLKGPKMYSLIPDLITGWKPKNIKIPSPIILKYKSPLTAQLLDYYEDEIHKIVYIGTIVVIQAPGTLAYFSLIHSQIWNHYRGHSEVYSKIAFL